jgi:D-tyrosyl-tRNA(Tyr) deacylase
MKIVVQRVVSARVEVDLANVGNITKGLLLLVCLEAGDDDKKISKAVEKIAKLRIFEDENGKMNLDVIQAQAQILSVSQFTLAWTGEGGNRPSFENAMQPAMAQLLWQKFNRLLEERLGQNIETGKFGAEMKIFMIGDGPVTFSLDF